MKKVFAVVMTAVIMLSVGLIGAHAADTVSVYVTIADQNGQLALAAEPVTVTDIDGDNVLTINDALYAAHEQFYPGGAAAGYATKETQYGLSMDKLWGAANGGSYGYYVNNASAWSMTDPVSSGDHLAAFVYTDLTAWSDMFTFFDTFMQDIEAGDVTVTLSGAGYDATWNPITVPVKGATVTVDGEVTEVTTDDEGKATLTLTQNGKHIVSATRADGIIVPPVMIVNVTGGIDPTTEPTQAVTEAVTESATQAATVKATPDQSSSSTNTAAVKTGDSATLIYILSCLIPVAAAAFILFKKKNYEK